MMATYIVCALLLIVAAGCKGVQDSIAHHNSQKWRGVWWDQDVSWAYKYNVAVITDTDHVRKVVSWSTIPKFFGSTTFLVFTTDAWHCFGMLNMSAWQAALCLLLPYPWYYQLAAFVGIKVIYGAFFELIYRHLNSKTS